MLNDADRKYLQQSVSDKAARQQWMCVFAIIVLAVGGMIHLVMATQIAHSRGETLLFIYQRWSEGIDTQEQYAGSLIKAIDELTDGLMGIGGATILSAFTWRMRRERERNQRIVSALKRSGTW